MYVKDHMTKDPVTITSDVSISKAVDMMARGGFHRLPVVDAEGKLIGLVTGGLVEEKSGSKATSLSIYELNYLLRKTKVADIMIRDTQTITQDVFVEEAAQKMLDNSISVLPVVDDDRHVVGIITEKDIFQAFTELLGYKHQGTRFVFNCDDRPGYFVGIIKALADQNANVESLAIYRTKERGTEAVVKATGEIPVEKMTKIFIDAGYRLTDIAQTTKFGTVKKYSVSDGE
ncbi:MAG: CBS domain-containing protein [Lachnospiraceae bacterium]|nr:CBS domain-containing protein [Lachnospiraceae bacterium]